MNFATLKSGFIDYLEQVQERKPWKHYETDSDNVSIFLYADEFKDYIKTIPGVDSSVCSESIEDILKMQFIDGKLVSAEEIEEEGLEPSGETLADIEHKEDSLNVDAPDGVDASKEPTEGEALQEGSDGEMQAGASENKKQPAVSSESTKKYAEENNVNMDSEVITGILNDMLSDESFIEVVDADGDGEVSDDELRAFLDVVKCYDENPDNISLDDLVAAASDIKSGMFKFATDEEIKEEIGETPEADAAGLTATPGVSGASGSGGDFSVPSTLKEELPKYDENGQAIVENMTKEELQTELTKAQGDLKTKQDKLSAIQNGTDPSIAALQKNVDETYQAYYDALDEVDSSMAQQLQSFKDDTDLKQAALDENSMAIDEQTDVVSNCQNEYDNAKNTRKALEDQLSNLKQAAESCSDDEKQSEIESKIKALEEEIEKAQEAENNAYSELTKEQKVLEELNSQTSVLEEDLSKAKDAQTEYETKISEAHPSLQKMLDAYNEARTKLETEKPKLIEQAREEVQKAQDYVSKISSALNDAQNKENIKENYSAGGNGEELIEFAKQFLGFSEGQMESVCGYNLPDGLWCAAFVKYIATEMYGDDLPSWYTNCNYNSCSEVLAAANKNGCAFKDSSQAQAGDMIIFNTSRGQARHIGFVVSVENGVVTTIEGNSGNKVSIRQYNASDTGRINSYVRAA